MKFKGTAVLVVLLLILTGWVYWTDIRGRDERAQAEEDASRVLAVDDEDIVELRLTYPDRVHRRTTNGRWMGVSDSRGFRGRFGSMGYGRSQCDPDRS